MQELFAQSPRGTALTHRIAIDAQLTHTKVLVVSADGTVAPVESPVTPRWLPLDTSGTRRVPRIRIRAGVSVQIDGTTAELVDLSTKGAQVLSATVLKPNQRVRVVLSIEPDTTRAVGPVAWATFELLKGTPEPRYRAGIEFSVAEAEPILRFCLMHADDSAPPRSG
ncbi:MAG: PilZ domain-containing protein [Acidobacteria bacterium]|nr:PilZ domain-containing protein [Acidobacteriota bacterium]